MKYYFIIGSIFIVLVFGSLFLFTKRTVEVETIHFNMNETEEAFKVLEFDIKQPTYLPNNMKLREVTIGMVDGKQQMIGLRYGNKDDIHGFEFSATLSGEPLKDIASKDEYWQWTEVEIGGIQGLVGINDSSKDRSIVFRIDGTLYRFYSKEMETRQLLKIAKSLE
ncbi:MAG: DUF4367 domain-containing protein [Bacillota bacterium]